MGKRNKVYPLLEKIEITSIAAEGKAIAKVEDLVIFVPYAVPGDVVDLQIIRKKHRYAEAEVVKFHSYSDNRVKALCQHYGVCGGCKWQVLAYEEQLKYKEQQVKDNFTRIGKLTYSSLLPILGSKKVYEYRNKLEFGFSNKKWLTKEEIALNKEIENRNAVGFHIAGAFDKILDIETCHLMPNLVNEIRNKIRDYAFEHHLTFYDIKQHQGLLRNMMVRSSASEEWMLLLQFHYETKEDETKAISLLEYLAESFPEITSLLYVNNLKKNDTLSDLRIHTFKGKDYMIERMGNLQFKVGPKSFYQTNSEQAYELYKIAINFADLTGTELVYDLYTGTGTIANFVAKKAKKVIGIEYVEEAIADAKINSALNSITNTLFFAGDMKDILNAEFIQEYGKPDVIITDPPRAGMHKDVIDTILFALPEKIVYVSCNPATQARDLALLSSSYSIVKIQPVDMFPQTHHIENVVLLKRN